MTSDIERSSKITPKKDLFNVDDVSDDVTVRLWTLSSIFMFRCLPDTKMATTPSVFELERPSIAQIVALGIAHLRRRSQILISLLDQKLFLHEYGGHFVKI